MSSKTLVLPLSAVLVLSCLTLAASCEQNRAPAKAATGGENKAMDKPANRSVEPPFAPQVAGRFYDSNPDKLRKEIQGYLDEAAKKKKSVGGDLLGLVVPHAGYPYSGPVAAHSFGLLEGRKYSRVVVLGPAHRRAYPLPALLDAAAYRTPLGDIPIDRQAIRALAETGAASVDREKFEGEHALEVELPFLQVALGDFQLVPIMISRGDPVSAKRLAKALKEVFPARDTLFVASTDLSHDYPYDVAVALDEHAMSLVEALDLDGLVEADRAFHKAGTGIRVGESGKPEPVCAQLCGLGPVLTLVALAQEFGQAEVQVLDRRTSGDIVGDRKSRIVGYGTAAVALETARPEPDASSDSTGDYLNTGEKAELLAIARKALQARLIEGETPDFEPEHDKLNQPGAAFVTLHKHGQLRGCIGYMEPADPLWKMIRDRAIDAATRDTRFPKVTTEELSDIHIEISVLTPRVPVKDPMKEIEIGRDGVWMELGGRRGVFLPQVPVEQGWNTVEIYLDNLCRKAHVPQRGCWRSAEAKIQKFTALVFGEKKEGGGH